MTPEEKNAFVREYLAYLAWNRLPDHLSTSRAEFDEYQRQITDRVKLNPHTDAPDEMFSFIHDEPALAWELLLRIADQADDAALGLLGAGDLETFVAVNAMEFADVIEAEIRRNVKIRKAFESLYIGSDTPVEIGRRFNTALRESGVSEEHIIDWWSDPESPSNST